MHHGLRSLSKKQAPCDLPFLYPGDEEVAAAAEEEAEDSMNSVAVLVLRYLIGNNIAGGTLMLSPQPLLPPPTMTMTMDSSFCRHFPWWQALAITLS